MYSGGKFVWILPVGGFCFLGFGIAKKPVRYRKICLVFATNFLGSILINFVYVSMEKRHSEQKDAANNKSGFFNKSSTSKNAFRGVAWYFYQAENLSSKRISVSESKSFFGEWTGTYDNRNGVFSSKKDLNKRKALNKKAIE